MLESRSVMCLQVVPVYGLAKVVAAVAGYAVGNLHIPGYDMPWEHKDFKYPSNMAPPLQVLIDCSNGASDYGNKFGEPLICGWTRSCGVRMPESGERFEWVKPIMLSGGLGQMDHNHLVKEEPKEGQLVVKIGGPAYRIGVGGGAASSMVAGDNQAELDFNAVQRGDAEMQQKVNRVVRACVELGPKNPILSIHDQGAGGSGNVLKEISEPAGAVIDLRKMHVGDPSMSILELWTAEFQENNALLLPAESAELFDKICKREKVSYAIMGTITGDGKVVVKDSRDASTPVDLPLDKVLGKMPQKVFPMQRLYKKPPRSLDLPASLTVQVALETGVLRLLSVCSKRFLTNKVDRSVTGQIAQQQCVGPLQTPLADFACIAQTPLATSGGATAIGEQPLKGLAGDPASCVSMARLAVAEALTNLVWIRIPTLDSIKASGNWMWAAKLPGEGPKMYDIAEALSHMMVELGIAIDGGKDSLSMASRVPLGNGQVETAKSPGQFVLTVYAPVPDVRIKVTPDLKTKGDGVLLFVDLGQGPPVLGGSALSQVFAQLGAGPSPQVHGDASADAEDERILTAVFAELAAEASEIERVALDLDRAGDPEQAVAVYRQVAERLAKAAASCPEGNPDRAVLARHAGEVLGRVVYLESLNGAPAAVPPEGHIGCDHLVIPGPGVERQVSDGFQLISSPRRESTWAKKAASAAAVSGAAGLLVLHAGAS
eukprot:s947_g4.t1